LDPSAIEMNPPASANGLNDESSPVDPGRVQPWASAARTCASLAGFATEWILVMRS
jgi:hypothetical protein